MKYTLSKDGQYRATINLASVRLTKPQLAEYNFKAKALGFKNLREYAHDIISNAIHLALHEQYEEEIGVEYATE